MKLIQYLVTIILCVMACSSFAQRDDNIIDQTIVNLLNEKIKDNRITIKAEYDSSSKLKKISDQQDKIQSVTLETFDPNYSSFRAKIQYQNGQIDTMSGKYRSYIDVPIAAKYIKFGDIIQSSDISSINIELDKLPNGFASSGEDVVGMQAKKYINSGGMIRMSDISNPPVIKNNDPVNIVYSSGVINLKTTGIALGAGAVGDMIKVKNSTSGAVILGQIINKNTIQVSGQ